MRGKQVTKRTVDPDPRFKSELVARLVNYIMLHGKKSIARKFVYGAMDQAGDKLKAEPLDVLTKAIDNIKPALEVRSRRVGGANYQVPMPVPEERQESLALRWIVKVVRGQRGSNFQQKLASEIIKAYNEEGDAFRMKIETEKMAEANKAFAHFRW
jgi:small subunit ribosomal protein S7